MSIFGSIMGAIFGHGAQAKTAEITTTAAPGTIRGDLGRDWGVAVQQNLVHGSDSPESAARELGIALLRLDTNSALAEAGQLYRRTGWTEIPRFNDDPYPDLFFEKHL